MNFGFIRKAVLIAVVNIFILILVIFEEFRIPFSFKRKQISYYFFPCWLKNIVECFVFLEPF